MSKTFTINIECQNEDTKNVVLTFFSNFKQNISPVLTSLFKGQNLESDPTISVSGDSVVIEQIASNKGMVLSATSGKVAAVEYSELDEGATYMVKEADKLVVFAKMNPETSDIKLGHFVDLDGALRNLNSEEVQKQLAERTKSTEPVEADDVIDVEVEEEN